MSEISDYIPKWTKKVVTEGGGRDPLGLSRVAFNLTDFLLTGIITTTHRARYYSFYTWAIWHIEKEENPKNYDEWLNAFRRREAAMALATLAAEPDISNPSTDSIISVADALGERNQKHIERLETAEVFSYPG